MKALVFVAVLGLLIAVPASAGSPHPQKAKIARLTKENRALRHRLHDMTIARNNERAKNVSLSAALAQRTSERDAAGNQAASLQARLAAIPTPLATAVAQVRREVAWGQSGSTLSYGRLVAEAAMNYTVGHVSTASYGYYALYGGTPYLSTPNDILGYQTGLCGKASYAFAAIVHAFGFDVRRVQFSWMLQNGTPDAHTAAEVYYDGGWHFFDPTFGVTWLDQNGNVLSIADARVGSPIQVKDTNSFTNLIEDPWFSGDDVSFELDPATVVLDPGEPFYL